MTQLTVADVRSVLGDVWFDVLSVRPDDDSDFFDLGGSSMQLVMMMLSVDERLGVSLSIDDFGTGWSSLGNLRQLPVDEIKIDRSFVAGMTADTNDATIVQSTIDLGRNLGLRVVAEGVECPRVRDQLVGLGCRLGQGYLFSPPLAGHALPARAAQRPPVPT